jgi:hypothetical protein
VIDFVLDEKLIELILPRQLLKLEVSDLRQIFVCLFQIPEIISLGPPLLVPGFAVVLLFKLPRGGISLPAARSYFLKELVV